MSSHTTAWKRPPVIEVVLGVQFHEIPALTNGHLGWFWHDMRAEFPNSDDVPPIEQEVFSDTVRFDLPMVKIQPHRGFRLRMASTDGTKMIQVQNGWLCANWVKKDQTGYPGFTGVKELFDDAMRRFAEFLQKQSLGTLRPNLWEVSYIDHLPQGTVWNTLADLPRVLPGLFGGGRCAYGSNETIDSTWTWWLSPTPGRLRLSVQSAQARSSFGRTRSDFGHHSAEILLVRSTARGPFNPDNPQSLDEALNFGRFSAVETFNAVVSDEAKRYWQGD